jgi:hypothetical protein
VRPPRSVNQIFAGAPIKKVDLQTGIERRRSFHENDFVLMQPAGYVFKTEFHSNLSGQYYGV